VPKAKYTPQQLKRFGDNLRRQMGDWTDEGLGRRIGVSKQSINQWKNGKQPGGPSPANVFAAEKALQLPPGALSSPLGFVPVSALSDPQSAVVADERLTLRVGPF
jgi:transcriptional regulator with XRE-family HTH domain